MYGGRDPGVTRPSAQRFPAPFGKLSYREMPQGSTHLNRRIYETGLAGGNAGGHCGVCLES